jgi:hypothetical protein
MHCTEHETTEDVLVVLAFFASCHSMNQSSTPTPPSEETLLEHATLLANGTLLAKREIEWRAKVLAQAFLARSETTAGSGETPRTDARQLADATRHSSDALDNAYELSRQLESELREMDEENTRLLNQSATPAGMDLRQVINGHEDGDTYVKVRRTDRRDDHD